MVCAALFKLVANESDHWITQMTCQRGASSVNPRCLVLVCVASHISVVHAPRAMYVTRAQGSQVWAKAWS